jgi:hypothetical protein
MSDDFHEGREDVLRGNSQFPPIEPKSFCSRPTPVVPARGDLLEFRADSLRPGTLGSQPAPAPSPSSRPTLTPEDLGIASPVSGSFAPEPEASGVVETGSLAPVSSLAPPAVEVGPIVSLEPGLYAAAEPMQRRTRRWRPIFARLLFVILFGGVAGLLGYAFRAQLADALREAQALAGSR